jgi:succinate dehydrogenase / fumarate reductase iron-sulfur subunit
MLMRFRLYRYRPEEDEKPWLQDVSLEIDPAGKMLLDALLALKAQDDSLSLRRSCREGVCGSDAMNVNGRNCLACVTPLDSLRQPVEIRPLPGLPVIRDLVVDMEPFYRQYRSVRPWLINDDPEPERERIQTPVARDALDGAYECILCGACTSSCPSFWWHPDKFVGPAGLLAAWRFVADSRDEATRERLDDLEDTWRLYRCRGIMNCVSVCPKGLNPTAAIGRLRELLARRKL